MKDSVSQYLHVRDALIYIANATKPVSGKEVAEYAMDIDERATRALLLKLYRRGLLLRKLEKSTWLYYPTTETSEMYGAKR